MNESANALLGQPAMVPSNRWLWVAGIGGVVLLGGLVVAVVMSAPAEEPGARRQYDLSRRRRAAYTYG